MSQVQDHLRRARVPAVVIEAFASNGVTGAMILDGITEEDLKEMGVSSNMHRRAIMSQLAALTLKVLQVSSVKLLNIISNHWDIKINS